MTGYRAPGPQGLANTMRAALDPGTLARCFSPTPGPFAVQVVNPQPAEPPEANQKPAINIDAAVAKLLAIALPDFTGKCATHVRRALQAGGGDLSKHPVYARDYGPTLLQLGFVTVAKGAYLPQKGDVVVFEDYQGQRIPAGHVQMYSGSDWVSDTRQPRFLAHRSNYAGVPYVIYRP